MTYLETAAQFYSEVAQEPQVGLCCVQSTPLQLPGLKIPLPMQEMNYGCGTTVHHSELFNQPTVLYVGVGGGLEALQFAYFSRYPGAVIAIEPVAAMGAAAARNLEIAAAENPWFDTSFVEIREGDAFNLPVAEASVDIVAQNCLFNIFEPEDLNRALTEAYRVLKPGGRLQMSDPIATCPIPAHLKQDERLRAMCLSGALTYEDYIQSIINAGFGQIEIRARRPYRLLDTQTYNLEKHLLLESLDSVAFKVDIPEDGACIFTGKTAIYAGAESSFDDQAGHVLMRGIPAAVCDKTAAKLASLHPDEIMITPSTWHHSGGGCC
ncbi:arsenosugar biosynthesis arsenite methyltransferase ArsM [Umezakia ovalisporum]|uniref:Arsenosugar biosynthesis arsenite methyltransferase ArsM n=1 Tax=Umezakia ovalisporum FSS-43 TaxID=2740520 RepID=A0ABT6K8K1_9CYAN|nr:arsenosugar biosynthesis arsenite methyltransferase ArsM [Umezakia ovalisporum]MDH6058741.1 arsenosugar biosynthesis arsenite methyltransferase ArsM [Umezakia ovalisporum FSS-43]MDH6066607.1 arsenosugar biosynthesis arsenite methyltransferase ArsM [Umezakia ovalisporum APH033B]MDH6072255.1 arsenosugar biosynthesis arsenite methyltransferase ArsM [Umezakia ovalisporum CobakiLakeA]MDH6072835.1 arsenosugar biosynthesis arsenite methyltransferase ArsM [Umezakia ovalisporum CS-1034]MDH6078924.1 